MTLLGRKKNLEQTPSPENRNPQTSSEHSEGSCALRGLRCKILLLGNKHGAPKTSGVAACGLNKEAKEISGLCSQHGHRLAFL